MFVSRERIDLIAQIEGQRAELECRISSTSPLLTCVFSFPTRRLCCADFVEAGIYISFRFDVLWNRYRLFPRNIVLAGKYVFLSGTGSSRAGEPRSRFLANTVFFGAVELCGMFGLHNAIKLCAYLSCAVQVHVSYE